MKILLIIPAYNEALNIKSTVEDLTENYPQYDYIVINDGSRDDTSKICHENKFNVIDLPVNIGLAGAVQAGMKFAVQYDYDAAIQFDGDGQHRPEYIKTLVNAMTDSNSDIVIGSRLNQEDCIKGMRKIGSKILQFLIRITTGREITDPTSGMRLFGKHVINEFAHNMNYSPEPDTVAYLIGKGLKVIEVPVEMNSRSTGESYLNPTRAIRYMLNTCMSIIFIQWFRVRWQ